MQKFRTIVNIDKADYEINYNSKLLFTGSCFTENTGSILKNLQFDICINPFGILYNPLSINDSLNILMQKKEFSENELFFSQEAWHSYNHHSRFSGTDKEQVLNNINTEIKKSADFLAHADYLFITFGTSYVYRRKDTGDIVTNCHKQPASKFSREFIDSDYVCEKYKELFASLKTFNKKLKIIFTISPVRHWKDGAIENNRSKANLIIAVHKLVNEFSNADYFPAYEIMMDDLRDYRFYENDMLHPNNTAVNYIFDNFKKAFFNDKTIARVKEVQKIIKVLNHRVFNKSSQSYKELINKTIDRLESIENESGTSFSGLKNELQKKI